MKRLLYKYLKSKGRRTQLEHIREERIKSHRLGELGFVVGAVIAAENEESDFGIMCGGVIGYIGAAIFECAFPKSANKIKRVL